MAFLEMSPLVEWQVTEECQVEIRERLINVTG